MAPKAWLAAAAALARPACAAQVALASGRDASTSVSITWITEEHEDSCGLTGYVDVAQSSNPSASFRALATSCSRYEFGSIFYGNYSSGLIHKASLEGLEPGEDYSYSIAGGEFNGSFATVGEGYPLSLGALGDIGQTADSVQTVKHLGSDPSLALLLHAGDMAYADTDGPRWDTYGEMIVGLSSRKQWMVAAGNHEIESDGYTGQGFVPYEARFAMPAAAAAVSNKPDERQVGCEHREPWGDWYTDCTPSAHRGNYIYGNSFYSFEAGPVHTVVLNTYAGCEPGTPQREWLEADLDGLDRVARPWLVVMMHGPMYNSNAAHQGEFSTLSARDELEVLFHQHGVALVLGGHVHAYERTHPVFQNETGTAEGQRGGATYITIGDGGNREGHASSFIHPVPEWSAFRNGTDFGHGKITLDNSTHMLWEWYVNDVDSEREIEARGMTGRELPARFAEDKIYIVNPGTML